MEDRIARQEEEILSGSLSHMFKIIEPEEERIVSTEDDKTRDINIGMLRQELSGLMGHLYGPEGKGGTLDRLEKGQAAVLDGIESLKTSFSDLTNMHMRDVSELNNKIDKNKGDIQSVADMIRLKKTRLEKISDKVVFLVIGGILTGLGTLIVAGVRMFLL